MEKGAARKMDKQMLDLYTDYLISSFSYTTATGLAKVVEKGVSHDQVTRFLSTKVHSPADLWRIVKPILRQIESDEGAIIIDDSIEEKPYTDESELICWHYDHSKDRNVKGINFLTALYYGQGTSLPVTFDLVTKTESVINKKTGKPQRKSSKTKNERYREMLKACLHNQISFRYVLNDAWFASAENMKFVRAELEKEFVMALKSNRKAALSLSDKEQGFYTAVSSLALEQNSVKQIYLEEVGFPLLLAKQVFKNEDSSQGVLYLVGSDLTLNYEQMTSTYKKRWKIEEFHKSLKQNASLEKSPTRTSATQSNHFFAALCAYVKLESMKLKTKLNHFALKSKIYFSALQSAFAELHKLNSQPLALAAAA